MGALILKLEGPLQSWGVDSRFTERKTQHEPTKSGVVGLMAAALGRRRDEDVSDLASCYMNVRTDVPGEYLRDFQTAHKRHFDSSRQEWIHGTSKKDSLPLSQRYYLQGAVFVVSLEGDGTLLANVATALDHPAYPLYLGRRSCAPSSRIFMFYEEDAHASNLLGSIPWQATEAQARRMSYGQMSFSLASAPIGKVCLPLTRDVHANEDGSGIRSTVRDVPMSFSPYHRTYGWRDVITDTIAVDNPYPDLFKIPAHDPFAALPTDEESS